jgi:putative spermidine/putrescine transport system substrate-binding protein
VPGERIQPKSPNVSQHPHLRPLRTRTIAGLCGFCALALWAAGSLFASAALAQDTLNIATWGGAYGQSQESAFFEPYAKETGTRIATEVYDGSLAKIKEMIEGGSSAIDVADVSAGALEALCKDGLLETIAPTALGPAPAGETVDQDFLAGGLSPCGVASVAWSTALVFDRQAFSKAQPAAITALLDAKRFPGKRALPNSPRRTLELALLADGVDPANVYSELATQEGADRAFKALDKIRGEIYWWDKAEEPMTWLLEKKAALAAAYSGRMFRAMVGTRQRFGVVWDGQIYDLDVWAIPKSARNKDGALRFIAFATDPARLARQAELIAYGPMRKSALALVGKHPVVDIEMGAFLPTTPDNFKKALKFDEAWWETNGAALTARFETWRGPLAPGQGKPPVVAAEPQEEAEAAQEPARSVP